MSSKKQLSTDTNTCLRVKRITCPRYKNDHLSTVIDNVVVEGGFVGREVHRYCP